MAQKENVPPQGPQGAKLDKMDQIFATPREEHELMEPAPEPSSGLGKESPVIGSRRTSLLMKAAAAVADASRLLKSHERRSSSNGPLDLHRPASQANRASFHPRELSTANPERLCLRSPSAGIPTGPRLISEEARDCRSEYRGNQQESRNSLLQRPPSPRTQLSAAPNQQKGSLPQHSSAFERATSAPSFRVGQPNAAHACMNAHNTPSSSPIRPSSGQDRNLRPNKPAYSSSPSPAHRSVETPPGYRRSSHTDSPVRSPGSVEIPPGYPASSPAPSNRSSPTSAHRSTASPAGHGRSSLANPLQVRPLVPERVKEKISAIPPLPPSLARAMPSADRAVSSSPRPLSRGAPETDNRRAGLSPRTSLLKSPSSKPRSPRLSSRERGEPHVNNQAQCRKSKPKLDSCNLRWLEEVLQPQPKCMSTVHDRLALRSLSGMDEHSSVAQEDIQFVEMLGTGSFGAVWKGNFQGQIVAVKQCVVGDIKDTHMLLEEIRCLQSLRHPRLVSYLGCCKKVPHVLLLMEYMSGGSLHELLFKKKRSLEFKEKARMAYEVADGLTYVHGLGVVHRDLKTANIVLDSQLQCKICDFGLTLMLEQSHVTVQKLEGSPRYMAPEQFQTKARITDKCDIWQFGCIMLELFCLVVPFSQCTGIQQIATELLVRKRPPSVPIEADPRARVFTQASLRISPSARPTAAALRRTLWAAWKDRAEADEEDLEEFSTKALQQVDVQFC